MIKKYFIYINILILFCGAQAFGMNSSDELENLVKINDFSSISSLLNVIYKELGNLGSLEKIEQKINSIFTYPIALAITNKKYNMAYYLIKKSIVHIKTKNKTLVLNLFNNSKDNSSLLKLILDSKDSSLRILANAWIGQKLIKILQKLDKELTVYEQVMKELPQNKLKLYIDHLKANGLSVDDIQEIFIQVLTILRIQLTDPDTKKISPLFKKMVDTIKKQGIDLEQSSLKEKKDKAYANYLLMIACQKPNQTFNKFIKQIFDQGAQVNSRALIKEDTPLILAIKSNQTKNAQFLIQKSADVNEWGEYKRTPLMIAALANNIILVQNLLQHGAEINAQDILGQTALMLITQKATKDQESEKTEKSTETEENIVDELIKHSADISIKDVFGMTALDYARKSNIPSIIAAIVNAQIKGKPLLLPERIHAVKTLTTTLNSLGTLNLKN